jgi:hypothetical protein
VPNVYAKRTDCAGRNATHVTGTIPCAPESPTRPLPQPWTASLMRETGSTTPATRRLVFDCVEVRRLSSAERALYHPLDSAFGSLSEIVGAWQENGEEFYFARSRGGEVHKVCSKPRYVLFASNARSSTPQQKCQHVEKIW